MTKTNDDEMLTIEQVISILLEYKDKYGNLYVGQIFYADGQYQKEDEVADVQPCLVTNPIDKSNYMIIFD